MKEVRRALMSRVSIVSQLLCSIYKILVSVCTVSDSPLSIHPSTVTYWYHFLEIVRRCKQAININLYHKKPCNFISSLLLIIVLKINKYFTICKQIKLSKLNKIIYQFCSFSLSPLPRSHSLFLSNFSSHAWVVSK